MSGDGTPVAYKDGENFTTYCDKPYDRHYYHLVMKSGKKHLIKDYDVARALWFQESPLVERIEVVDK